MHIICAFLCPKIKTDVFKAQQIGRYLMESLSDLVIKALGVGLFFRLGVPKDHP